MQKYLCKQHSVYGAVQLSLGQKGPCVVKQTNFYITYIIIAVAFLSIRRRFHNIASTRGYGVSVWHNARIVTVAISSSTWNIQISFELDILYLIFLFA